MTIANIMVAVDLGAHARDRVRLAAHLADDFQGRLIGVAAEMPDYSWAPAGPTPGGAYGYPSIQEAVLDDLKQAHAAFQEATAGCSRTEWRSKLEYPSAFLTSQAAVADLMVLGRGRDGNSYLTVDPGEILMCLGLPVLVVPPSVDHLDVKRVAVGWKNTREARRAVRDALPFLKRAAEAVVVAVDDGRGSDDTRDVLAFLQAHDVYATSVRTEAQGIGAAEALVDAAAECGADLIVTGAYGHGRLREWVFGGVTRNLLVGSPVCCLMSH
ncbi:universal stress protein [Methylobacterium mesophilicum]